MWKNYLKIGIRNILKKKVFSLINIFGLALGMSVCMVIILMLADQKSYDQFHRNKDRIYRVLSDEDNSKAPNAVTAYPLAHVLKSDYPIIEDVTQLIRGVGGEVQYNNSIIATGGYFTDPSFFNVFGFELEVGDKKNALALPYSMVISKAMSERLFNDESPIGKTVKYIDRGNGLDGETVNWGLYTITGVIANEEYKSHLDFEVLLSSSSIPPLVQTNTIQDFTSNWRESQSYTYVMLSPDKDKEDLNAALNDITSQHYTGPEVPKGFKLILQELCDITPGIMVRNETRATLPMLAYYFLAILALLIMFSACLNYTNLSIARSLTRAKEIGIRKVTGANKRNLVLQFLSESILTALFALAFSFLILFFIKPAFKGLSVNQYLNFDLNGNMAVYFIFLGFTLVIGLLAGAYPALQLSKYSPIKALNNQSGDNPGKLGLRKALSTSQFIISLFFINTSFLIYNQFKHYLEFEYGFNSKNIVNIALQGNDHEKVAHEMNSLSGVYSVSATDIITATNVDNGTSLKRSGTEGDYKDFNILLTDENFLDNLDLKLIAGNNLPASSSRFIIVNEAAVREYGFQNPEEMLGQVFESKYSDEALEVIGVVKDFRFKMLMNEHHIGPLMLQNQPDQFKFLQVKINSSDLTGTLAAIEEKWELIDPVHAFEYGFFEDQLDAMYQGIFDMVSLLGFIAFLAITIACLGMFAMAIYTTERRKKEVGIRKVLGAGNFNIVLLLSKGFLKILMIAILIGTPITYLINNLWLQNFPNRVDFGWSTITLGAVILLILGTITVGSQTFLATIKNPVDSLKSD